MTYVSNSHRALYEHVLAKIEEAEGGLFVLSLNPADGLWTAKMSELTANPEGSFAMRLAATGQGATAGEAVRRMVAAGG